MPRENTGFEFYDGSEILKLGAVWNIVFGERTAGKTYFFLKWAIQRYYEHGEKLAVVRRYSVDVNTRQCTRYFLNLVRTVTPAGDVVRAIEEVTEGKWNDIYYFSGRWWLAYTEDGKMIEKDGTPFAYAFALSQWEHDKGGTDGDICNIIFDEFLTRPTEYGGYLTDEFTLFINLVNSVIRLKTEVRIFLLGNTVNQYNPYFTEMLGRRAKYQPIGTIEKYRYGKDPREFVAVERTGVHASQKPNNYIFSFRSQKAAMITEGAWEWDIYPHLPEECSYTPDDILFVYFVVFDGEIMQCEIIDNGSYCFTFVHRKTSPIKDEDKDLIYSLEHNPRRNWRRQLNVPIDDIDKRIGRFFIEGQVYYQDNEIGDLMTNYLDSARKAR